MTLGPLMVDIEGVALTPADRAFLSQPAIGGVILFTRNFQNTEQVSELIREIKSIRSPQLLVAVDQEGGRVQRFRDAFVELPAMRSLGRRFDQDAREALIAARETGWLLAAELAAVGVDMSFTPVVDLDWGVSDVIGDRSFHRAPEAVAELATALMRGLHDAGLPAIAKHYPGHGAVVADSHVELPIDRRELADLLEDLKPFERLIRDGLNGIMTAHVVYSECDGLPPTFSRWWLTDYLRGRLGFNGVIFSDDLDMQATRKFGSIPSCARQALEAGCDVVLVCNNRPQAEASAEALSSWSSPPSMLRRASLRASQNEDWRTLRESDRWRNARSLVDALAAPPDFELNA